MTRLSLENIKARFERGDKPDAEDYIALIDTLAAQAAELGTAGNNETEINGIENETVIESFPFAQWRMVKYLVSISKTSGGDNKFYATEISILIDGNDINVAEYGVIDNDGDMGTITVSKNGSNLELKVAPDSAIRPITVRYARVGLKA